MPFLILAALAVPFVLLYVEVIGIPLVIVAEIGIVLAAGWWFDRGRAVGARDPFLDANRPDFSTPFTAMVPPLPTEVVDNPKDRPGKL